MAILLIRHGETAGNRDRVVQVPETPLSEHGLAQAARLGQRFAKLPIAEIWTSPLTRARQTAQAVERSTRAPLVEVQDLEERNFGSLRGTPYSELKVDPFVDGFDAPGGEGWDEFHQRVERMWEEIERHWFDRHARAAEPGHFAVVSHGLFLRALLERRLLSPGQLERFGAGTGQITMPNTAVSILDPVLGAPRSGREHRFERIACVEHLGAEQVLDTNSSL